MNKNIIYLPYKTLTLSTSVNGETVWYRNKFKNFLLKIKHLFYKSENLKSLKRLSNIKIDPSKYEEITINNKNK